MKLEATMREIEQDATTTEPNKHKIVVIINGNKKECDKAWKAISKIEQLI